jgi:hypothetical protein
MQLEPELAGFAKKEFARILGGCLKMLLGNERLWN